ncbi:MAG TPA: phosphocholine cytidylyltransferase family protein [Phycisphaerae bacterium]|nr:phosphocholine cytidylyltransferase family protein [Phycisphaerae bacterium]
MRAIILAAGAGRRLGLSIPKCMIDLGGRSILHRQLDAFRAAGVDDFIIVVGHLREQVIEHLSGRPGRFTFIANDRYAETNTCYSLYLARSCIDRDFFYANADVLFDARLARRLCDPANQQAAALAVQVGRCAEEEVKVIVRDGRITRISKKLDPKDCLGEFVGVARFSATIAPAFVKALEICIEQENAVNDYFERAVDRLCGDWSLIPVDVSDLPCIEIDFPADLDRAKREISPLLCLD